jgi:hypothetical protein
LSQDSAIGAVLSIEYLAVLTEDEACSTIDISALRRANPATSGGGDKIDAPSHHAKVLAHSEATDYHGRGSSTPKAFLDR